MKFVSLKWKYAAEQNLSNTSRNRQAWLGQAACCFNHGCSESLTKKAWHQLNISDQNKANEIADKVIHEWEQYYINKLISKSNQLNFGF